MCDHPEPNPELATSVSFRMTWPSEYSTGFCVAQVNSFLVDDLGSGMYFACVDSPPPFGQSPLHLGVTSGGIGGSGGDPDEGTKPDD